MADLRAALSPELYERVRRRFAMWDTVSAALLQLFNTAQVRTNEGS